MIGRPFNFNDYDHLGFVAVNGNETREFEDFYGIESFILGEPEDDLEPHLDWQFGIKGRELYHPSTKEEAETQMAEFEEKCRLEAWEKSFKNEDNSIFTPKREWLESELKSVTEQIEDLQTKKRRLEEILK
jgi:hypothetical protein